MFVAGTSLLIADAARGADRSDPIAATVGPPGGVGFYVNPSAPGLDAARVQSIIVRSIARWGNTYLGTTTNAPGAADGQNVIGVIDLPAGTLGLAESRSKQTETPVAAKQTCVPAQREITQTVVRRNQRQRVLIRSDRIVGGGVKRRTLRRTLRRPVFSLRRGPAVAQLCTLGAATTNLTPTLEFDVSLAPSPTSGPWTLGPAFPNSTQFDFETNTLHELGHVSGLAHLIDGCDPSTPTPVSQGLGEYWHGPEPGEWFRPPPACPANPAPPAPINGSDSTEPLPGPGATALAGQSILINPRVPAGYDSARFVAVAARAIQRAGGTVAGVTDVAPSNGDGTSVLGFATLGVGTLTTSRGTPRQEVVKSYKLQACRRANVRVRRQVVVRAFVRRGALRLRRDAIKTRTRTVKGYRCTSTTRPQKTTALPPELDLRVNDKTIAWEFGPGLPVNGTRWDLETALLQNVMGAGGAPAGTSCDTATPHSSSGAAPGDWWRSTAEVRRARCVTGPPFSAEGRSSRTLRTAGGGGLEHRASGLPYDVKYTP